MKVSRALLGLWAVALVLALAGLGNLPLRDWDEGIVARVALETSQASWPETLLPTFWGSSYLNKPPGLHWLIAGVIQLWRALSGEATTRPPEWVIRLAPAIVSSLLVPLIGAIQLRLRPGQPLAAVGAAAIALTLMPLARHGRLAMLDGAQLTAMALLWLGLLLARPRPRTALVGGLIAGAGGSGLLLLKAPVLLPVLATGLLLRWLDRDLDRQAWLRLGLGLGLGLSVGMAWHGWHGLQRGSEALLMWGGQGLLRFTATVEEHHGSPLEPLLEVLEGGWPWLPLWPIGLVLAWRERRQPAGRWSLGLSLAASLTVLPMKTQLPWYSLLLWPPFCLICGPILARLVEGPRPRGLLGRLPWFWAALGGLLLLASVLLPQSFRWLPLPAGLGLLLGGIALSRPAQGKRRLGLTLLLLGWSASLLLFFLSPFWNWELNETWSVLPAAELARGVEGDSPKAKLPIHMPGNEGQRPSLRWYAEQELFNLPDSPRDHWQKRFRVLLRPVDGVGRLEPGNPGRLRLQDATCDLEARGGDSWQRWICAGEAKTPAPQAP
ncbi:4-amino-4-deoxy-L-arabinose transferase [Synechococcus sp. Cruz-9H2]|uniref:ArnT family glycosyltransferase n=1 Tax=unclassified Synechococcus TaxID=2626047 RepID=UPI0020CC5BB0|nr:MULTISPECIES: 4-amino-4-deoxy-L-arabinose transferase [unclassified Synechococcus]MCP9820828.1 4-amino-4-deoxy-L-arabinose transferase [Synechococcus sp. Cruz-9H2]MCP9845026.1 4-amino-4-deoxy-L-arabinose transferase [Synechococcus sp. Edmonson 11F2]MCP9857184.1 4-amino-4-deoxy-L-arabinose transferase [Synechococcus sp. Cruz-9C9]MCP9864432.1 4-amino-4-deoxy-L-arabinose transferase [Synechococcus sp. Cruz-7E5]MCP9871738.1 4-amino-4-deoxy-L-arabinose transferase [Synechococcus sp. Cruz-7B9]